MRKTRGEGGLPYKSDGDARRKIKTKLPVYIEGRLMWVWLRLKLAPKDFCVVSVTASFFVNFFIHSPKRYLNGQI